MVYWTKSKKLYHYYTSWADCVPPEIRTVKIRSAKLTELSWPAYGCACVCVHNTKAITGDRFILDCIPQFSL